jgi:hypothetical protein
MKQKTPDTSLPRELARSAPRDVKLTAGGVAAMFGIFALLAGALVAAVLLSAKAERDAERLRLLDTEARTTMATVTSVRRPRGNNPEVTINYRYTASGREHAARVKLRKRDPLGRHVRAGTSVPVRYLPSQPEASWVEGYRPKAFPFLLAVAIPALAVLGTLPVWIAVRRQRQLLSEGRAAMARVTGTKKTISEYGTRWRVHIEWLTLSGATRTGRFTHDKPPEVGALLPIVYDPDQPRRYRRYPMCLVRVATK